MISGRRPAVGPLGRPKSIPVWAKNFKVLHVALPLQQVMKFTNGSVIIANHCLVDGM
jgi:hypothetical protein